MAEEASATEMEQGNWEACDMCGGDHNIEECPEMGFEENAGTQEGGVMSLAHLTLPTDLEFVRFMPEDSCGVVAKQTVPAKTKFGPFESKKTTFELQTPNLFVLKIFSKDGTSVTLDTSDENECNWLCLVRTASSADDQNCIVYQKGPELYYMSTKQINPKEELRVWYAPHYARKLGKPLAPNGETQIMLGQSIVWLTSAPLTLSSSPLKIINKNGDDIQAGAGDTTDWMFICEKCNISFPSEEDLQHHVNSHTLLEIASEAVEPEKQVPAPTETTPFKISTDLTCRTCKAKFETTSALAVHIREHIRSQFPSSSRKSKLFNCIVCKTKWKSKASLRMHMKKHRKLRWRCIECGLNFYLKNLVEVHLDVRHKMTLENCGDLIERPSGEKQAEEADKSAHYSEKEEGENSKKQENEDQQSQDLADLNALLSELEKQTSDPKAATTEADGKQKNENNVSVNKGKRKIEQVKKSAVVVVEPRRSSRGRIIKPKVWAIEDEQTLNKNVKPAEDEDFEEESSEEEEEEKDDDDDFVVPIKGSPGRAKRQKLSPSANKTKTVEQQEVEDNDDSKSFPCCKCYQVFENEEEVKEHLQNCTEDPELKVGLENNDDSTPPRIRIQELQKYKTVIEDSGKEAYKCPDCGKLFEKGRYLLNHMQIHSGRYTCEKCNRSFARTESLAKHTCSAGKEDESFEEYPCDICGLHFGNQVNLFRHLAIHTGEFKCSKCGVTYSRKRTLLSHLAKCNPDQLSEQKDGTSYPCTYCSKVFVKLLSLKNHLMLHESDGKFKCEKCLHIYADQAELDSHECQPETEGDEKWSSCPLCDKMFSKQKYLERHMAKHTGQFKCSICEKQFARKEDILKHAVKCEANIELEQEGIIQCKECEDTFTNVRDYRHHVVLHRQPHQCGKCGRTFARKTSQVDHETKCVGRFGNQTECDICHKKFADPRYLVRHMAVHNVPNYECQFCKKKFFRTDYLNHHTCRRPDGSVVRLKTNMRRHTKTIEDPHICFVCGKTYVSKSNLNKHIKTHGEKMFSCDICDKQFHIRHQMIEHQKSVHVDERLFKCDECGKMLKTKLTLYAHKRQFHNDQATLHQCSTCQKVFRQKGNLLKHMLKHDDTKHFKCTHCPMTFRYPEQIYRHNLEHTQGKKFECTHCNKKFVLKYELRKHNMEFHSGMMYVCPFCSETCRYRHTLRRHVKRKHPSQAHMLDKSHFIDGLLKKVESAEEPRIRITTPRKIQPVPEPKQQQHIFVQIQDPHNQDQTRVIQIHGAEPGQEFQLNQMGQLVIQQNASEGDNITRQIFQLQDGRVELADNSSQVIQIQGDSQQLTDESHILDDLPTDVAEALRTAQALQSLSSSMGGTGENIAGTKTVSLADVQAQLEGNQIISNPEVATATSNLAVENDDQIQYLLVPMEEQGQI